MHLQLGIFNLATLSSLVISIILHTKIRITESKNLSTDADSRTDTILERLHDLSAKKEKKKKGGATNEWPGSDHVT